jgi:hypothetical protein
MKTWRFVARDRVHDQPNAWHFHQKRLWHGQTEVYAIHAHPAMRHALVVGVAAETPRYGTQGAIPELCIVR